MTVGNRWLLASALAVGIAAAPAVDAAQKHKIFLSMSYIGNDWQAEAANMVKAMATHKSLADKVSLEVQVAGPNAQRQIQQINAMVQAGAEAIVVFPISPTALNQVVKSACDKGVKIFAYDAEITEPCAYNVHIDQEEAGRKPAEWLVEKLAVKGISLLSPACPELRSTRSAPRRQKKSSPNIPESRSSRKQSECGARR